MSSKPLLSKRATARYIKATTSTVNYLITSGFIPAVTINAKGWVKVPREALDRLLAEGTTTGPIGTTDGGN